MRNSRFVVALAAVACAAALPAAAAAHKGHPFHHGHPGKGKDGNATVVRLAPGGRTEGQGRRRAQAAHGRAERLPARLRADARPVLRQPSALRLVPGSGRRGRDLPRHLRRRARRRQARHHCADRRGRQLRGRRLLIDVHAGPTVETRRSSPAATSSQDAEAAASVGLKGANHERGRAELFQKGNDVSAWIKLSGLTPGAHAVHSRRHRAPHQAASRSASATSPPGPTARPCEARRDLDVPVVGKGFTIDVSAGRQRGAGRGRRLRRSVRRRLASTATSQVIPAAGADAHPPRARRTRGGRARARPLASFWAMTFSRRRGRAVRARARATSGRALRASV